MREEKLANNQPDLLLKLLGRKEQNDECIICNAALLLAPNIPLECSETSILSALNCLDRHNLRCLWHLQYVNFSCREVSHMPHRAM